MSRDKSGLADESLRRWCIESVTLVRQTFARHHHLQPKQDPSTDLTESIVEDAAFLRIRRNRGLNEYQTGDNPRSPGGAGDISEQLSASCPLDAMAPPEQLGTLHECLIGLRNQWDSSGARRSSKSRKTNGVYYTPRYVIDDMVRRTIGPRLIGATPENFRCLRILDPAAGCGAFLIAACRFLMEWHLDWYIRHDPAEHSGDVLQAEHGWKLTLNKGRQILTDCIFGVDLDPGAVAVTRRILWLTLQDFTESIRASERSEPDWDELVTNVKCGHSLNGDGFAKPVTSRQDSAGASSFHWTREFPGISEEGGFDVILGNPPYRRERDFKTQLDEIAATPFGRKYQSPRMDLWYFFLHRGIELLKNGGTLAFITSAYWIRGNGADKLMAALRDDVHLDDIFLLGNHPVFAGVSGQHSILTMTKSNSNRETTIRIAPAKPGRSAEPLFNGEVPIRTIVKPPDKLFRDGRLDTSPAADSLLEKLDACSRLGEFGKVRQGIAENPAAISRATLERFHEHPLSQSWQSGEGVFSLSDAEAKTLLPGEANRKLLRPYYDLCDLGRYRLAASPSRQLIYSTRKTCPDIEVFPQLQQHLARFRPIMDARRETIRGSNCWWHLHWPRDESLWLADKLVALQMATRPGFVPTFGPAYVTFSANVFVPEKETREDLKYFCGLLNSRVLWAWFALHAKRRGIGLELNGHVLERAPMRRIDFGKTSDVSQHDELVALVDRRMSLQPSEVDAKTNGMPHDNCDIDEVESQIDHAVMLLYGLSPEDADLVAEFTV